MDLNELIKGGHFNQSRPEYYKLSDEAKNLIEGLLKVSPDDRLTVETALGH